MGDGLAKGGRVRQPVTFSRERAATGELHLLRARVEALLTDLGALIAEGEQEDAWLRVEEAARLARRALAAAVAAVPPLPALTASAGELVVGRLRVDTVARRQWYGEREFELTPLHHQLLAVLAADPFRVFAKDELARAVWRRGEAAGTNAVNTSVSRLRRALVAAGPPRGRFLLSVHGIGWALTRPE
jgi:DNA-binding response OmpR family regulator